jgi:catechol 2,3-dioxygenase-like lactoylglutathione lyase family enzyme
MRPLILLALLGFLPLIASGSPETENRAWKASPHPLLHEGYGIDHVTLAVRDIEAARTHFHTGLGFKLPPSGKVGKHPTGTKNASSYFANQSYLSILAVDELDKVRENQPAILDFLKGGDGAIGFVFSTSSASRTADRLRDLRVPHKAPVPGTIAKPGRTAPLQPEWLTVSLVPALKFPFSFIQYLDVDYGDIFNNWTSGFAEASSTDFYAHPNTATGLSSVWIVVPRVDEALDGYISMLSSSGERVKFSDLEAEGVMFTVVRQRVYLLQPTASSGPAADFIASRGSGVMGMSIEVKSLETAASRLKLGNVRVESDRRGPMSRTGLLIPPSEAFGVWIEFHETGK